MQECFFTLLLRGRDYEGEKLARGGHRPASGSCITALERLKGLDSPGHFLWWLVDGGFPYDILTMFHHQPRTLKIV